MKRLGAAIYVAAMLAATFAGAKPAGAQTAGAPAAVPGAQGILAAGDSVEIARMVLRENALKLYGWSERK